MNQWIRIGVSIDLVFYICIPLQTALHYTCIIPHYCTLLLLAAYILGGVIEDTIHISYHKNLDWGWLIPNYKRTKDAHMRHHYRDNSKEYGVTTDIYDYIFGTTNLPKKN